MKSVFIGSCTAMTTPFDTHGNVDTETLIRQTEFQLENKTDALLVLGTTGEASTLSDEERKTVIRTVIHTVAHRVPVIVGAGSNDTKKALDNARMAKDEGADAHLQVTPYYNKTTQDGLIAHYTYIADRVDLPMILYNVPSRTGLDIKPETYAKLCRHPNIAATKEASGNLIAVARIMALCKDSLDVYSGDDALTVPFLALGAKGVISVLSNIMPNEVSEICRHHRRGKAAHAASLQLSLSDVIAALFCETNPIPVKAAMAMIGLDSGVTRLPLIEMSPQGKERMQSVLKSHHLI